MNGMITEIRANSRMKNSHFVFFCCDVRYTIDRLCRCPVIKEFGDVVMVMGWGKHRKPGPKRIVCHATKFPRLEKFRGMLSIAVLYIPGC